MVKISPSDCRYRLPLSYIDSWFRIQWAFLNSERRGIIYLQFFACSSPISTCRLVLTTSKGNVTMDAIWKKWMETGVSKKQLTVHVLTEMFSVKFSCWCAYRARHSSRNECDAESGFSGIVVFTQPALALLIVVPVHGWEGYVSEQRGSQSSPQRHPALCLHWWADAISQFPVRLFLRLHLGAD